MMRIGPAVVILFGAFSMAVAEAGQPADGREQLTPPAESAEPTPSPDVTVPPGHTSAPLETIDPEPGYSGDRDVVGPDEVPAPGADAPVRTADEDDDVTLRDCQQFLEVARERHDTAGGASAEAEELLDRAEGHLEAGDARRCIQLVQDAEDMME